MTPQRIEQLNTLMETISTGLEENVLPTQQQLRELQNALNGQNTLDIHQRMRALLDRVHNEMVLQSRHEISDDLRGLRTAIGAPSLAPNEQAPQPEFAQPFNVRQESLNPGLRSPILGTTAAVGAGILGTSLLWNLFTNTRNTLRNIALTGVTGVAAVAGIVAGYRVPWREVGTTISSWFSGIGGSIGDGASMIPNAFAWTVLHVLAPAGLATESMRQWALSRQNPEQQKKEQEVKKQEEEIAKKTAETLSNPDGTIHVTNDQLRIGNHNILHLAQHRPIRIGVHQLNVLRENNSYIFVVNGQRFRLSGGPLGSDLGGIVDRAQVVNVGTPPQQFLKSEGNTILGRDSRYIKIADDLPTFLQAVVATPAGPTRQVALTCYKEHTRAGNGDVAAGDIVLTGNTILRRDSGRTVGVTRA